MITLPPFKSFLASNIPSVYDNTLSYYDELTKLIGYLEKVVVPAVNKNTEDITLLEAKIVELKKYVEDYFKNLDVQEEINNKLDDMAESGELADIIAQYLELAGVLAFNTLDDLVDADNIASGSTCRIMGKESLKDGHSAYYKIRPLVNTDIIDGDNIISLTNYPTLVGEKLPYYLDNLGKSQGLYLASFFDNDYENKNFLYASCDGKTFKKLGHKPWVNARDADIIYYDNKFYAVTTQTTGDLSIADLYVSEDLVNWKRKPLYLDLGQSDPTFRNYPCDWFVDNDGRVYLSGAYQVGTMTDDQTSATLKDFRIYIVEVTNMDFDHFTLGTPNKLTSINYNLIDPSIVKKNATYYMFAKKEGSQSPYKGGTIQTFTSSNLVTWTLQSSTIGTIDDYKFEAPCVVFDGSEYIMYIDSYTGTHGNNMHYITSADLTTWSAPKVLECEGYPTRHGSVTKLDSGVAEKVVLSYEGKYGTDYTNDTKKTIVLPRVNANYTNKYVKIATIKNYYTYRAMSMTFKVKDIENNYFDSVYHLSIYRDGSSATADMYEEYYVRSNINKIILQKIDNNTFELYYSTRTQTACTPAVEIIDVIGVDYDVDVADEIKVVDSMTAGTSITASRGYAKLSTSNTFRVEAIETGAGETSITATYNAIRAYQSFSVLIYGRNNALLFQSQVDSGGAISSGESKAYDITAQGKTYTVTINNNTVTVSGLSAYDEYTLLINDPDGTVTFSK